MPVVRSIVAAVIVLTGIGPVNAGDRCRFYTYRAHITSVYDGDTVTANIDLGFRTWVRGEKIRLYGIDAPELRARARHPLRQNERARGLAARDALRAKILDKDVILCTIKDKKGKDKKGKYGRYLARISTLDGLNLNDWLLQKGYAKPYMLKNVASN